MGPKGLNRHKNVEIVIISVNLNPQISRKIQEIL